VNRITPRSLIPGLARRTKNTFSTNLVELSKRPVSVNAKDGKKKAVAAVAATAFEKT